MAGFRSRVFNNIPKVDLQSYILLVCGNYKSGKTRLWKELIEYFYPSEPDAGLLIAWEGGFKTWKLKSVVDLTIYKKEEPRGKKPKTDIELDADRWLYYKNEIVPGLVQEAGEGRISKVIGTDTADRQIDCASAFIITEANRKYPGNNFTSIQELSESKVYKENVWTNLYDELKRPNDAIRGAGYGLVFLAWTKEKTTELIDGLKYNSIELMMNATCRKVFQSQADLICCLHNDVKILDKDGKELDKNLEDKKGREVATNFHESQTMMYFRESNYIGIAGGRFVNLPEKAPYGIKTFVEVFEQAVEGQLDGESVEDVRKEEIKQLEEKAHQFASEIAEQEELANKIIETDPSKIIAEITEIIKSLPNVDKKNELAAGFKDKFGFTPAPKYKECTDIEKLTQALEYAKTI